MKYALQILALALVCNCFAACKKSCEKTESTKTTEKEAPKKS
jgi:hypothetical protein